MSATDEQLLRMMTDPTYATETAAELRRLAGDTQPDRDREDYRLGDDPIRWTPERSRG